PGVASTSLSPECAVRLLVPYAGEESMELLASSFGLMGRSLLLALAALATFSNAAFAQPALETKQRFVAALIRFMAALPGTYGDEGPRLGSTLEHMEAARR